MTEFDRKYVRCPRCGRHMLPASLEVHERGICPVLRFTALLKTPGELKSTEEQRREVRRLYEARVRNPLPHELDQALETASHEAVEAILGWIFYINPHPGKSRDPETRKALKRAECPKCEASVIATYLQAHLKTYCLGSKAAREAQEAQRAENRKSTCSDCGLKYNQGALHYHLRVDCPVMTLSTLLDRVGQEKATKEQIMEVRKLYAEQVPLPMPQKLVERLDGACYAVAEGLIEWLRHRQARGLQERAE